jgi:hypothetical protein
MLAARPVLVNINQTNPEEWLLRLGNWSGSLEVMQMK